MDDLSMLLVAKCLLAGRVVVPRLSHKRIGKLAMETLIQCCVPGSVLHMEAKMALLLSNFWVPSSLRATLANRRKEWKAQGRM